MENSSNNEEICEMGYLKRADGSCLYADKQFAVIVSVFGPGDLKASKQIPDKMLVEVTMNKLPYMKNDANFESLLKGLCQSVLDVNSFPRTCVSIAIQLLEVDDNGIFWQAGCLNALCLALLDSGLPMKLSFVAVAVAKNSDNQLVTREAPSLKPLKQISFDSNFLFVFSNINSNNGKNVLATLSSGNFEIDIFKRALCIAQSASTSFFDFQRSCIERKLNSVFDVHNFTVRQL